MIARIKSHPRITRITRISFFDPCHADHVTERQGAISGLPIATIQNCKSAKSAKSADGLYPRNLSASAISRRRV
jgi:hypothetical protein